MTGSTMRLWLARTPPILASGSRTRAVLLQSAGLAVEIIKPAVDERAIEAAAKDLSPSDLACRLAVAKAEHVAQRHPSRITIGADQVLEVDGDVLHKPVDIDEARRHVGRLQGRSHELHSAVAIVHDGMTDVFHETARLTMRRLGPDAITAYLALTGEARVTSSVGGYQLEGAGIHLFERIDGDHTTVLGLPLLPLLARLRALGVLAIA